jgi:hypothetical protein
MLHLRSAGASQSVHIVAAFGLVGMVATASPAPRHYGSGISCGSREA